MSSLEINVQGINFFHNDNKVGTITTTNEGIMLDNIIDVGSSLGITGSNLSLLDQTGAAISTVVIPSGGSSLEVINSAPIVQNVNTFTSFIYNTLFKSEDAYPLKSGQILGVRFEQTGASVLVKSPFAVGYTLCISETLDFATSFSLTSTFALYETSQGTQSTFIQAMIPEQFVPTPKSYFVLVKMCVNTSGFTGVTFTVPSNSVNATLLT